MKPDPVQEAADRLDAALSLADPRMRELAAERALARLAPDDVVALLGTFHKAGAIFAKASDALAVVLSALHRGLDASRKSAVAAAARARGETLLASLVDGPEARRVYDESDEEHYDVTMAAKTLGLRRSLARTHNKDTLARLAHDPDPLVVRNLLANPLLTEAAVVRIAAHRPARAEVLSEIYHSPRWTTSRAVRRALARNPYTPVEVALRVVSLLLTQDLREIARDASLHPAVRFAALERRRGRRGA